MKTRNLASPRHCLCFNMRRATRLVTRAYDEALAPAGLTAAQFSALTLLREAGPMTTMEFAAAMETERTTATRNLSLLEAAGLVSRQSGEDRRVREVALTRRGKARITTALPLWRRAQKSLVQHLGEKISHRTLTNTAAIEAVFESAR